MDFTTKNVAVAMIKLKMKSKDGLRKYLAGVYKRDDCKRIIDRYRAKHPMFNTLYVNSGLDYNRLIDIAHHAK
jgi:hypothetical protein